MKTNPKTTIDRRELNLRLGIKSSLYNLRSIVALLYALYVANGKKSRVDYSEEFIGEDGLTHLNLNANIEGSIASLLCVDSIAETNINSTPLFKAQMESLQVGIELFLKLGKIRFNDDSLSSASERTGGNRYQKYIEFSTNIQILDIFLSNYAELLPSFLLSWLSNADSEHLQIDNGVKRILTIFTEETQFKIRTDVGDVIFQQEGIYKEIADGNTVENTSQENVGPFRVLKSYMKEGLHPYIEETRDGFDARVLDDATSEYFKMVSTSLDLIPKRTTITTEVPQEIDIPEEDQDNIIAGEEYSKEDFLAEVFMKEEQYDAIIELLERKKNIILQGAPGVGKTFAAKRLAYSILGCKDESKVEFIQFHQSYAYEDFVLGYKPTETGFTIEEGPFYKFCKKAEANGGKHFFIIDEINRGNLSRIFGELLVLTEATKRNESATLLYTKESFKVPDNVYIIGMMNTADRSLAMIDYALRRRFSFFPMEPAFGLESFNSYLDKIATPKAKVLVAKIIELNNEIESDDNLGRGFKIGHSYLCAEDLSDESLKAIVQYEIIPLLEEYWYDEPSKVEKWSQELLSALK